MFTAKKDLYKRFTHGLIFCKTSFNKSYDYVPSSWVYSQYDPEALKNLMKIQKGIRANGYVPPHAFVVFDDCLSNKHFKSDLFKYVNNIETVNSECCSHAVIFKQFTKPAIEAIYNSFGQRFDSERVFKHYVNKNTGDFKFVFVDNDAIDNDINKQYSIRKCPAKIGNPYIPYVAKLDVSILEKEQ